MTIADPFVVTDLPLLPDTSRADLTVKATLQNHSPRQQSGWLRGVIGPAVFQQRVTLAAGQELAVSLDPSTQPALALAHPKLWWPNGYGQPDLYDFTLRFEGDDGRVSDVKTAKIGIRKFTYGPGLWLTILCNGQKIFLKGSNWGMDEGMMRCDRRRCEARLRMERDMHFNLLRSCLGNVAKEDFFDLCDRMWDDCTGMMIWMSNLCWPSLIFNTYDYYLEPTAAYFACRKACEPIHVQWNIDTGAVKAANATLRDLAGLKVTARVFNMDGSERLHRTARLDCPANRARKCFDLFAAEASDESSSLSNVHFIKLELADRDGQLLSDNFYWRGKSLWEYEDLGRMRPVALRGSYGTERICSSYKMDVQLYNPGKDVALMVRLKLLDTKTGLPVTPITYSDNYFSFTPGEAKQVTVQFDADSVPEGRTALMVEGWNVVATKL